MGKRKKDPKKQSPTAIASAPFMQRHATAFVFAILFLALILRIAAWKGFMNSIYAGVPIMDEEFYHLWASKIADGTFSSGATFRSAPLPAYLMAWIYWVFSPDITYVRTFHVILGVLTCWMIYGIGRSLGDRVTGLWSCLIAALYGPFIFYSAVPLNTMQSVALFAATVLLFLATIEALSGMPDRLPTAGSSSVKYFEKKVWIFASLLGFAVGLLVETRGNAVIMVPVIPAALLFFAFRDKAPLKKTSAVVAVFVLGFAVAVAPFAVRNRLATGHFSLSTAQTGFALYTGNNLGNPDPYYRPVPFASSMPSEQLVQMTIEASRRAGKKLSHQQASAFWIREIMKTAMEKPSPILKKIGEKVLVLFSRFEAGDHYDIDFMSRFIPLFKFPFLSFALILPLGAAGMLMSIGGSNKESGAVSLFIFYGATLVVFFTSDRLRLPLLTLLIPFAVLGAGRFVRFMKAKSYKQAAPYALAVIVFSIIAGMPVRATQDRTSYYNTHANILLYKGFGPEAVSYWKQSSQMNGSYSAFANLSLARIYYLRGDHALGDQHLDRIRAGSFAEAWKYDLYGDALMKSGRKDKAEQAYARSLEINSGNRSVMIKLMQLYEGSDPRRARQMEKKIQYISSFYDVI
jgi:4-amino-4-deoxy-L-arabinose transferase-like glycosyltransferase